MLHIELGEIRYNPTNSTYEARVDIDRKGRTYRYPCSIPGTILMDEPSLCRKLRAQALRMADHSGGLHSIR